MVDERLFVLYLTLSIEARLHMHSIRLHCMGQLSRAQSSTMTIPYGAKFSRNTSNFCRSQGFKLATPTSGQPHVFS